MDLFFLLALIGGLLAVDDRAGWQSLLAQPIFASLFVGAVTGEIAVALPVGLILELVWLSIMPMRGSRRPDQVLGAIVGSGTACLLAKLAGDPRLLLITSTGALCGFLAGELGGRFTNFFFGSLGRSLGRVELDSSEGYAATAARITWLHASSVVYIFAVETVAVFFSLKLAYAVAEWGTAEAGRFVIDGAAYWIALVPAIGAAAVIQIYWRQPLRRVLVLSSVMVVLVLWLR